MFEKEAEEYRKDLKSKFFLSEPQLDLAYQGFKDGVNTVLDKFKEMRLKEVESQFIKVLDGLSSWKAESN